MELWTDLALLALGTVVGSVLAVAWFFSRRIVAPAPPRQVVPEGALPVLGALKSSTLVVDPHGTVLHASAHGYQMGIVRGNRITNAEIAGMIEQVAGDRVIRDAEMTLDASSRRPVFVAARVAPLGEDLVLVLVEDRTKEHRVESIRRDFVANVSHELKTPVGAMNLLAEAIQEAADDPEAVVRFSERMQQESKRLSRLVQQIIELSRLQGDEPVAVSAQVDVNAVIARSIDRSIIEADQKKIALVQDTAGPLAVEGNADQIALAIGNLVSNAVNYSPERSTVVVSARQHDDTVDLSVTDQGIGIPEDELPRIFERFYRVDPARHRSTGGTGLGLSIVKHIAASHGGEVRVWSKEGQGSTFTVSLPRHHAPEEKS